MIEPVETDDLVADDGTVGQEPLNEAESHSEWSARAVEQTSCPGEAGGLLIGGAGWYAEDAARRRIEPLRATVAVEHNHALFQ